MKQIPLTRGYVAFVDDEDYDRVIAAGPWRAHPDHGTVYAMRSVRKDGKWTTQSLHRFILGLTAQEILVDHRDHKGLNNCRSNLRVATPAQNGANRRKRNGTTSRFKGVCWDKRLQKWRARIGINGKHKHLGFFDNEADAAYAYYLAACEHFQEFQTTSVAPRKAKK
jgi:hypothetical protein